MNRRMFLLSGSAALAAIVPPSDQVVIGLIGVGSRGKQLLAILLDEPAVRIGAVCETYEPRMFEAAARARGRGHSTRIYRLYRDLLTDGSLDAVVIATPDFWHYRMTLEALEHAKDVYVEQPLTRTWQEGVSLLDAAAASKQVVQVGAQQRSEKPKPLAPIRRFSLRCTSNYLRHDVLRRGPAKLPDPLNFEDWQAASERHVPYSPDRFLNWRFYSDYGGGCVTDLGTPLVDRIHFAAGLSYPELVVASGESPKAAGFDTAPRAKIEITYPGGVRATVTIDGQGPASPDANDTALTRRLLEDFLESVRSRKPPRAQPKDVFPATLVCQMANVSIQAGRKVLWHAIERRAE